MFYSEREDQKDQWYVMRALYRTELQMKTRLDEAGIRCFIPIKETIVTTRGGRKKRMKVPAVSNLIFVNSTQKRLSPFTDQDSRFQYIYKRGGMSNEPLIVPDKQMEDFIKACENSEHPLYFAPDELNLARGTKVRIVGGPLDGSEGILMKVSGARARRLVISIPSAMNVAVEISPDLIEIIDKK